MKCPVCSGTDILIEPTKEKNINSYLCFTCGFTTDDSKIRINENENIIKTNHSKLIETLSMYESEEPNAKKWYPSLFIHTNGMVYPEGENEFNWNWVYVPIIKLTNEELKEEKYSEFETRMAVEDKKTYGRFEFLDALKNLGEINEELDK